MEEDGVSSRSDNLRRHIKKKEEKRVGGWANTWIERKCQGVELKRGQEGVSSSHRESERERSEGVVKDSERRRWKTEKP